MTFTYNLDNVTDRERVRFKIQDTDKDLEKYDDETIAFVISEEGSWQAACISLVQALIMKLSHEPDFDADWLQVDHARATKDLNKLLSQLRTEFGISVSSASKVAYMHRKAYE